MNLQQSFKDKVIWVTGASSGIGEATVLELSKLGAKLIISSRNSEALYRVKEVASGNLLNIHVLPLNLENTNKLESKASAAIRIFGRIDMIIHSGGVSQRSLALETSMAVVERIMKINYLGTVALTQAVLPSMISNGAGTIVVISSLVGKFGTRFRSAYAGSKHALHGYFDSLRIETAEKGIRISIICPGFIKTNVSVNALTADGSPQNSMDDAQANGMSAADFAHQMLKAIAKNKQEAYIGGKETKAVLLKRLAPKFFARMMQKAKVV